MNEEQMADRIRWDKLPPASTPTPGDLRMSADDADVRATEVVMSSAFVRAAADAWERTEHALVVAGDTAMELKRRLEAAGGEVRKWESVYGKWPGGPALNMDAAQQVAEAASAGLARIERERWCPGCGHTLVQCYDARKVGAVACCPDCNHSAGAYVALA